MFCFDIIYNKKNYVLKVYLVNKVNIFINLNSIFVFLSCFWNFVKDERVWCGDDD